MLRNSRFYDLPVTFLQVIEFLDNAFADFDCSRIEFRALSEISISVIIWYKLVYGRTVNVELFNVMEFLFRNLVHSRMIVMPLSCTRVWKEGD